MATRANRPATGLQTFRTLAAFRLHRLARLSERFYEQFYQREFGLSLIECRLIGITGGHGQVSFKHAYEEASIDKSHASRLIDRMIRRGLLQKVSNPSDQRSVMLALTGAGRDCHRALHTRVTRLSDEWLAVLDPRARKSFLESLLTLTERIRAMGEAEARRRQGRRGVRRRAALETRPAEPEPPLPQVVVDRKTARQLYDLLGSALGNGVARSGRNAR